jgi:hypothetical protein
MINFTTRAQIGYAKSIVIRQVTDALHEDLKDTDAGENPSSPPPS